MTLVFEDLELSVVAEMENFGSKITYLDPHPSLHLTTFVTSTWVFELNFRLSASSTANLTFFASFEAKY